MNWSFPIGRLLGSELRVHATFPLLLIWIGGTAWSYGGLPAALWNVAFILALFACVVAHEYGHALMARRFGIATPDITLLPIGGVARLQRIPVNPGQEIAVALAGPAVNLVLWAALAIILGVETRLLNLQQIDNPTIGFLNRLAAVNIFLALFNMVPAFPMDGGRVLRATLSFRMDRVRATRLATRVGQLIAIGLGILGLSSGNLLLVLIAVFVFIAANAENAQVALEARSFPAQARHVMITSKVFLADDDTLGTAAAKLGGASMGPEVPVLDSAGRLIGLLTPQALFEAMAADRQHETVGAITRRNIPRVLPDTPLDAALAALQAGFPAVGVVDRSDRFRGYITPESVEAFLARRR